MAEYIWPWPKGTRASQEFGAFPGGVNPAGGHTGLDAALPIGTPLRAPADGIVTLEGWMQTSNGSDNPYWLTDGGGICYAMDFGDGRPAMTMGHLSATFVSRNQRVKQGDIVAESGNTGRWTTGPHTHLEFLPPVFNLNGPTYGRVNPRDYCKGYWEDVAQATLPYQRESLTKVNQRNRPDHLGTLIIKLWDENLLFDMGGWTNGSDPHGDGNRVWFKGKYSDTWFHSSGFKDMDPHDLEFINTAPIVPVPVPVPVPPPPAPVTALHGVDVSNHQGDIDLSLIPGNFVAIKASEGVGYRDVKLDRNAANVGTHRVRMFYHFARPDLGNTPEAELQWFLTVVRPLLRLGDVLVLDWEAGDAAQLGRVDWTDAFLTGLQQAHGGVPVLYAGNAAINAAGPRWEPVENRFPLWYPAYPKGNDVIDGFHPEAAGPRPPVVWGGKSMLIWQYTSTGKLPSYGGNLDLNVFYGTLQDLGALGVTKLGTAPAPDPDPKPIPVPGKVLPTKDQPISALVDYYRE